MITTLTDTLKGILGINKQISEKEIECAIDEQTVDCVVMEEEPAYIGVPAPAVLQDDPWFGPAVVSGKGQDYMEKEAEIKQQEEENRQYWTNESDNIHQLMYDMATKSGATTVQLDPIGGSENFQGGSENVHR